MAWNKAEAIRRREEARQQTYNSFGEQETTRPVDSWERSSGATNSSAVRTQSDVTRNTQSYTAARNAQKLASDWATSVTNYLTSGSRDENTRKALASQYNGITNYLKTWGKDIGENTLKDINSVLEGVNAYFDPNTARQAFQNGSISAKELDSINSRVNPVLNDGTKYNGNFDRYAKENITDQYVDRANAYVDAYLNAYAEESAQKAREIINQDPTRTTEYERAAQLSQYINSGGSLDGLSESDKDKASALLEKWSQNKVNKDYNDRVNSQVDNTIDFSNEIGQTTPQGSNEIPTQQRTLAPLEASTNELTAAYNTTVLNRQNEKIADMVANDPGTAMQYYSMYIHDMDKLGGSYKAQDITSTATYNEAVTYGYLKATQGEDAADKYWRALKGELIQRSAEKDIEYVADALGGSKFAHGVANLATQLGANANTIVGSLASPLTYLPGLDSYRQFTADMLQYQNAVKAQNAQEVAGDSKLARVLWEGTSSGIENVVEAAAAGKIADSIGLTAADPSLIGREGTLAYDGLLAQEKAREDFISVFVTLGMSSGAAMTAVEEGKAKGYSADEAAIRGLISGAIEFMTEKVGMDGVFKAVGEGRGALMAILKSGLAEGSEELVGNNLDRLATAIADAVTKKDASEYQQKVREYISQGMSETEAMQKVMLDYVDEDVEAFASAFFSAGMSAGGMGALTGNDIRTRREINYITNDAETRQAFIESGLESDKNTEAYKIASEIQEKLDSGEKVSPAEYEALYYANTRAEMGVADTVTGRAEIDMAEIARNEESTKAKETAPYQQTVKTAEGLKQLKNTLGSEGQKLFDNAINEAIRNKADRAQAYREVTNVYNAGAGVTNTYTATHLTADTTQALYKAGIADRETYAAKEANNKLMKNVSAGVAETPALTQAIEDGRVSTKTRNALDSLGKKLGTRIEIYNSNAEYNGQYNPNDSTIRLYLDSTLLKSADTDTILRATAGHEITHRLQSLSSKHYEALVQTVADTMGSEFSNAVNKYKAKDSRLSNAQAQDEVIADFVGRKIFTDDAFLDRLVNNIATSDTTVAEKKSALQSLKDFFHKIASWIRGNKVTDVSIDRIREIENKIDSIIKAGVENLKNAEAVMADDIGNVSDAVFSIKYKDAIAERQQTYYENNKGKYAKDFGSILDEALGDMKKMADIMAVHQDILPADKVGKVLIKNGSYDVSVENTTICVRTLAYNQFVDMVQDKVGRPLTQMESFLVSQKMYDIAKDPQCLYCYVSLDRKAYTEMLNRYIDDRDSAVKAYEKAGKPALPKNFLSSESASEKFTLYKEFLHGRKNTTNMRVRYANWINAYNDGVRLLTKYDLRTEALRSGLAQNGTAEEKAQLKDVLAYAQSASWAKKQMDYVAYNGDILKLSQRVVNNLNQHYGLRFYSFSDYTAAFIVENMQQITDASLKGLKGLAYTKDTDFVEIFAPSGININISVFAKMNPNTGEYEIDPLQSADIQKAIELRKLYDNVGIVVVATEEAGVRWALDQEWSDVVIPFHTVRTGSDVADFYNWEVFTNEQGDYVADKNLWDQYVDSLNLKSEAARKKVSKDVYPSEHHNDLATYKKILAQRGLKPRFERFMDNPNYMKLVNETRKSADNTPAMQPIFDLKAAERSFGKFTDKGGYYGGWYNEGVNVESEAQTVAEDVLAGKKANEVDYGRQDIDVEKIAKSRKTNRQHMRNSVKDTEYMDAVNNGDWETAQRMVKEAAAAIGYTVEGYHGTQQFGFTKIDTSKSDDRLSFFVTNDINTARTYSATEDIRQIREGGASIDELEDAENEALEAVRNAVMEFTYAMSAHVGVQGWLDYKGTQAYLDKIFEANADDVDSLEPELYDALNDYWYDVYMNDTAEEEDPDYYEWLESNGNLEEAGDNIVHAYIQYANASSADTARGNYHVYINPAGILEVDGQGKQWNQIPFMPKEIQELTEKIDAYMKARLEADNDSLPWGDPPKKTALKDDTGYNELLKQLADLRAKYHWGLRGTTHTTRGLARWAADNGYTGVLFHNIIDDGGRSVKRAPVSDVYALFNPQAQVKSADPVTYDNNGNVIPLSERFNESNADIRFSRKGSPQIDYDTAIQLQETNKQLQAEVERLRTEFKRKPIDVKDFSSRVTRTIRSYEGTVDAQEIIDSLLPDARKFVLNPNKENEAKLYGKIQDAAHKIITTALTRDEFSEAAQVREFLKGRRIKVSPKIKSDFGDWMKDYHQRYFGNLFFTNDKGTSVEETYSELQGQFGEGMFPSYYTNPSDQLEHILEVYEAVDSYYNPYDGQTAEAIESLSMELVANVLDTKVKYTYADKMHDRIARLRAEKNQKYEDLKAHYREVAENARNRRDERETRRRLLNVAQRLERIKTTAANRALIESLIGDLDTISMGMTGQGFESLQNLSRWYDSVMEDPDFVRDPNIEEKIKRLNKKHINGITRNIGTYATLAEAKLAQKNYDGDGTTNIRKTPEGYVVTAHEDVMSIEDVRDLLDVLLNVENEIRTAKQLIDTEDRRDTFEMAQQIVEDIRQSAGVKDVTAMFDRYIVQGTLSPERAIHRYTGYVENDPLYLATKNLSSGQRNMLDYQYRANKRFLKFTEDGKFMDEITGKKAKALKYKMTNIQGNEVEVAITPAMRISLYLHSLNPQNLRHIVVGGLTVPTWNDYVKGKMETAYATGTVVRLTPSEIRSITSQMTTKEMALAREVYNYFNGMSQDAINAVSEKLKGYALARVSGYFPINTDNNFLHKEFGKLMENGTIQGMGFLQERNKNAVNPVRLRDVTDVLKQSIDMTSKYVGLAIPVSNINKLLNAQAGVWDKETETWKVETAVKKELSLKWKDKSIDYIEKLIGDLQNPINTQEDLDKVLSKVRSNYAGAVLTLNLSVAMKQAASYPTAAAVVGWKPLAKAMTQFGSVDLDLIARYTPLQWYRTQGYSTQELGDIKSRGKLMSNLPKALNWIQAVDLATTRKLWKAAEIYVQENNKVLSVGTDEYYKAVAEIYNQIIEETQPNYTTMQRPEMLRSNSPMIQAISMFKTQPFQNFNITFDAVANYLAKKTADKNLNTEQSHAEFLKAQKRLSWAVTSQVAQLFTFAAMTLLWNALRGKWKKYKDKDGNLNAGTVTTGVAKDMASSLFSEVPFGAEAWGFISSKLFGDTYYGFDSVSVSALNDMVSAFGKAGTAISDFVGKDDEDEKDEKNEKKRDVNSLRLSLDSAAKAITKVFGIPYENVENLFNIGFMNIAERLAPAFGGNKYEGHMAYLKLTVDPNKYKSDYYDNLIAAYENDKEAYKGIYDEMVKMDAFATSTKTAEENITAKVDEYLKEKYNLKVKPTKYEGVEPETLQKISEALVKADANNEDPKKRNESYDMNEIYNALMSLALDKQTAEKVWANEYGGGTTLDEYITAQNKKAEARSELEGQLNKAGVTMDEYNDVLDKMGSKSQANVFAALQDTDLSLSEKRAVWNTFGWKKSYDDYKKAYKEPKETVPEEPEEEPEEPKNEGYVSVGSSWISGLEYDNATGTLYVTTNSGRTYTHSCSYDTYQAFKNSDSPGSFYNSHFK